MSTEDIDFAAMKVGERVDLAPGIWEGAPRQQFQAASTFAATHEGVQFQVDHDWRTNTRGLQEARFYITRIR